MDGINQSAGGGDKEGSEGPYQKKGNCGRRKEERPVKKPTWTTGPKDLRVFPKKVQGPKSWLKKMGQKKRRWGGKEGG